MGDMKDKFKGFMKKVNNQLNTSSSGKFKGQGRVLGSSSSSSSSGVANPNRQFVNPHRNLNQVSGNSSSSSKPVSQKLPNCSSTVSKSSIEGQNDSNLNSDMKLDLGQNRPTVDGFDPYGSLVTSGKRNKNGFSLNVFECPVCSRAFGSEDEVSAHIDTCIGENDSNVGGVEGVGLSLVSEDESRNEVGACVGVYVSGNPPVGSVDVVLRLFGNIVREPENQKFRRIRMSNPKIREAIGDVAGGVELLERVGFELKEDGGEMWAVMDTPSKEGAIVIKETIRLLEQAKNAPSSEVDNNVTEISSKVDNNVKEPEIVDRQIKVFFSVSESVAARIELPESFYKLSIEEVRREAEMKKKKMADSQLLIPKSFKEKQAQAARRRYTRTVIRVQFPDGVVLQGVFSPKEPTSALYEFVSSSLKQQGLEFELIHPIPVKRRVIPCVPKAGERVSTFDDEDLIPSALVKFKPLETDTMVFTGLKNELLEISEPLGSTTS